MPGVVSAFVRHEQLEGAAINSQTWSNVRGRTALPKPSVWRTPARSIEVRAVGWKKSQERTGLLNRRAHLGLFVDSVEHHNIARAQRRHQN
jgi:hypothetical protein